MAGGNPMAIDPIWIWIALAALTLIVIAGLIARGSRRARTESLREKFGNEYDHAVDSVGSRKGAERELVARAQEVGKYDIRPLTASEHDRYRRDWQRVEQRFKIGRASCRKECRCGRGPAR